MYRVLLLAITFSFLLFSQTNSNSTISAFINKKIIDYELYSLEKYKQINHKELYAKHKEEAMGEITLNTLALLSKNTYEKEDYYKERNISLPKSFLNIKDFLRDKKVFSKYKISSDKTIVAIYKNNTNKAIVAFYGGDEMCLWGEIYVLILKDNYLRMLAVDGYSADYAPVAPPETNLSR